MSIVLIVLIFVITVAVVFIVTGALARRNSSEGVRNRLGTITGGYTPEQIAPVQQAPSLTTITERPDILPTITDYLSSNNLGKSLRLQLHQGGLRVRPAEFVGLCAAGVIGMGLIGLFLTNHWIMGIIMGAIGLIVPIGILKYRQNTRTGRFDAQLPDALTLVASSLRTGYSFMHSCEMVVSEMTGPIAEEFAWVQGEVKLGVPMDQSLIRMVKRIKSYDFDLVVTAVSIQLQVGGNLAEILDTIAGTIRERVRIKGEINALTAEGKLSGVIVFILPIVLALFLNLHDPTYFKPMLANPVGVDMIYATAVLMVLGGLIIKKMVDIDV